MEKPIQCSRCVMDNHSDPAITFNDKQECNYCTKALTQKEYIYFPNEVGAAKLETLISQIKLDGQGKKYDCLMGISGGLDSSYLAMLGHRWGLRILALHVDDGFDTELAQDNIKKLCEKASLDLVTIRPDTTQFNALTKAYILAGVPNLAIPQDNTLFAEIYAYMRKYKVKHFLTGGNFALESILQRGNSHSAMDTKNIRAIHKRFGTAPIDQLRFLSETQKLKNRFLYGIRTSRPLNFIDYNKQRAINELCVFCDFKYYDAKHLENKLTKVHQLYWIYHKFGVDKRKSHLSSLIVSNQMTREEALQELNKPVYDPIAMENDLELVLTHLGLNRTEFEAIVLKPGIQHTEYPYAKHRLLKLLRRFGWVKRWIRL